MSWCSTIAIALGLAACTSEEPAAPGTSADAVTVKEAAPITLSNWSAHPKIVAIRKEVEAVDALSLTTSRKDLCDGVGPVEFLREEGVDAAGKVRRYVATAAEVHGAIESTYVYDAKGYLRSVLTTENDVRGNSSEHRAYFDATDNETPKPIWEVYRSASDPVGNDPDVSKTPYVAPPYPIEVPALLFVNPHKVFLEAQSCN